jgi:hypothetical protein
MRLREIPAVGCRTVDTVKFTDGSVVDIEGVGIILYECKNGEHRSLSNVYFIPRLTTSIISVGQLDEFEFEIQIKRGIMSVREEEQRLLARVHRGAERLYRLELKIARHVCLAAHSGESAWCWHVRFGHVNFTSLKKMAVGGLVRGLPKLEQLEKLCEACLVGKHKRTPFSSQASRCASKSLELLHGDRCGAIKPPTPSGNQYFLLLVDDFSRYMWVSLMASKDCAIAAIKRI